MRRTRATPIFKWIREMRFGSVQVSFLHIEYSISRQQRLPQPLLGSQPALSGSQQRWGCISYEAGRLYIKAISRDKGGVLVYLRHVCFRVPPHHLVEG
ncbi:hypothetical protein J6590_020578 [Homalodisca vitripennis]|nr:hypothetical protein J6590_020578 [Homalodisca vitripennis]